MQLIIIFDIDLHVKRLKAKRITIYSNGVKETQFRME